jgi:membrane protein implicated in regulation of membrane protease activity
VAGQAGGNPPTACADQVDVSLLAAGIIFLVTGLRSGQAGEFNINLLAAGVDFAVTSLVTAFVVERFRTLREARSQARLYEVVTDR